MQSLAAYNPLDIRPPHKRALDGAATLAAQLGQNIPEDHFLGGWIRGHLALGRAFGLGRALAARRLGPQMWSPRDIGSGALTHRPAIRAARPLLHLRAILRHYTAGRARNPPSLPAQARVVYHFSVPLLSALPTEASVEQGPAEGLERRLNPSSITEAAAGGSAACQKDHMAHSSQNRDGAFRAARM